MGRWFVALLFLVLLGLPARILAETYVAAGIGMNAPFDTTDAGKGGPPERPVLRRQDRPLL